MRRNSSGRPRPARRRAKNQSASPRAWAWAADFGESGGGEDAAAADVELAPGDVLPRVREHRIALDGAGAASMRELHGGAREDTADAAAPEARAGDEAGRRPDAGVGLVLRATPARGRGSRAAGADGRCGEPPRTSRRARRRGGRRARSSWQTPGDHSGSARGAGRAVPRADRGPGLPESHPVPLALASGGIAPGAEHGPQVGAARLIGGRDGDRGIASVSGECPPSAQYRSVTFSEDGQVAFPLREASTAGTFLAAVQRARELAGVGSA